MNVLYLGAGVALLVAAVVDLLWTTLWVDGGAGPLSRRLSTWAWRGLRTVGRGRSRALSLGGPLILVLTLATWVGLIWAGWTVVFAAGDPALIDAREGRPLGWTDLAWYAAYTMFTDGNGDFTPNGGTWQLVSSLTTASGMLFVTMGVSFVLSVLGAVAEKRSFAKGVTGLGERSEAFLRAGWNDGDFGDLELLLDTLSSELNTLAEHHKSYPILHYYHSEEATSASAMAVVVLDEALTVLRHGVPDEHRPNPALVTSARSSTSDYLETLDDAYVEPTDRAPPPPALDGLREAGVPTVSDEEFAAALAELDDRRRRLLATVEADAWHWPRHDDG